MPDSEHHLSDEDRLEAELVLLVDGRLDSEREAALEARAEADPELANRIALVRAGRDELHAAAAATEAPFELRQRIDALSAQPRRRRRRWRPLGMLAGAGAVAAVGLALLLTASGAPSVGDVLDAAGRQPAAAISPPGAGPLLPENVEGVHFPNYEEKFGWRAVGKRDDEIDGRDVTTVVYENGDDRVSYSIVAGDALDEPDGPELEVEGTRLRRIGSENAVTWQRGDHTCVMSGSSGVSLSTVAELAGWKAKGEIRF